MSSSMCPRLRLDLVHQLIEMGNHPMWVIKDPVAGAYFHFTESEYALLNLADGERRIDQIHEAVESQFRTISIDRLAVKHFFDQAAVCGLFASGFATVGRTSELPDAANPRVHCRPTSWQRWLMIRLPGFHPKRLLDVIAPWTGWVFSRPVQSLWMVSLPIAAIAILLRFDRFSADLALLARQPLVSTAVVVGTISLAKIAHEVGHAVACRRTECECREMGVMLLFGIPCLYVDVSDSWMLPRRRDRMMISAAGMYVETLIAVAATFLWMTVSTTTTGSTSQWAALVVMVCSISTLLVNGNPLLRYDGYYLLSDAVGVPNLAARCRVALRSWMTRFGPAANHVSGPDPGFRLWMVGYAIASSLYRWTIWVGILWVVISFLDSRGMSFAATSFAKISLVVFLIFQLRVIVKKDVLGRRSMVPVVATAVAIAAACVPFPRRVVAPMIVVPRDSQEVYVTEAGFLREAVSYGQMVRADTTLATLSSDSLNRQHAEATAVRDQVATRLQTRKLERTSDGESATEIPALKDELKHAESQLRSLDDKMARLSVRVLNPGMVFYPATATHLATRLDRHDPISASRPLHISGRWLPQGTPIATIGSADRRDAILYLTDQQVASVSVGQIAMLLIPDAPRGSVRGTVDEIDSVPSPVIPSALIEDGLILPTDVASNSHVARNRYRVRVRLDASDDAGLGAMPASRIGRSMIYTAPESVVTRIYRWLSATFRM